MIRALPTEQRALLDIQVLDTQLARLSFERRSLPVLTKLEELAKDRLSRTEVKTRLGIELTDAQRELRKAEGDVEQVRERMTRHNSRLESGAVSSKDAQALLQELELLRDRLTLLEDVELEEMERVESLEQAIADVDGHLKDLDVTETELAEERDREFARLDSAAGELTEKRKALTDPLPPDLLALYEKVRERTGGIGAVALRGRIVEGAALDLPLTEIEEIRSAPEDAVVTTEDDGYILVRLD